MLEKAIHRTAQKKTEAAPEQTSRVKMALLIFAYFIKIGSFTFGSGWSILAQMEQEFVDKRRWLTKQELLELVAVGKSLPGIMITNITMLFGYQMAGVLGGVLAVLGIALPAVVVLSLVTLAYDAIKSNYWVWAALQGVQCAVVPIIGGAAISLGKESPFWPSVWGWLHGETPLPIGPAPIPTISPLRRKSRSSGRKWG